MLVRCLFACLALVAGVAVADDATRLSLAQAQSLALSRNPDLAQVRAALAAAAAQVQVAGAAPNPVLGIATSGISPAGRSAGGLWRRPIDTVLSLNQLIERGGKRALREAGALALAGAAGDDVQNAQRVLRLLVAHAYADLHAAQDRRAAIVDADRLQQAMLAAARTRRDAGDVAGADVERVRVDALRVRNELAAAGSELARARQALALVAGLPEADQFEAVDSWPGAEEAMRPTGLSVEEIVERRADVQAAAARVRAAGIGERLAESLRTRDLSVGVQLEHYPQPGALDNPDGNSVGISVSMPLFTRYDFRGEIAASLAASAAADANYRRVRAAALAELANARTALDGAAERVRRNRDELLVAAEKASQAAEFAYSNGAVGVMDVLDARRTLRATRLDALDALADLSKALASWQAATELPEPDKR